MPNELIDKKLAVTEIIEKAMEAFENHPLLVGGNILISATIPHETDPNARYHTLQGDRNITYGVAVAMLENSATAFEELLKAKSPANFDDKINQEKESVDA